MTDRADLLPRKQIAMAIPAARVCAAVLWSLMFIGALVMMVAAPGAATGAPGDQLVGTRWVFVAERQSQASRPYILNEAYVQFDPEGPADASDEDADEVRLRISGSDGCNRVTGAATRSADRLVFGPLKTTRIACPHLSAQQQFARALSDSRRYIVVDAVLILEDTPAASAWEFDASAATPPK